MSADELLSQRWIFSKDDDGDVFKSLALRWHPDRNPDPRAGAVFAHIKTQWDAIRRGEYPNTVTVKTPHGDQHHPYLAVFPFELGEVYICERHVIWATQRANDDLARRWLSTVKQFKFPNDKVRDELTLELPRNSHTLGNGDRAYTICDRPRDYVRVADILAKQGPLDPRHVAWIMSRAYRLIGFLNYAKITHLDISAETMFVEPATHHGALLGGWFYTKGPADAKALAAPTSTARLATRAPGWIHLTQVRTMGRHLLGCDQFSDIRKRKDVPEPMRTWLIGGSSENTIEEEQRWKRVLEASFGKRRFTVMDVKTSDIYG